MGQAKRPGAGSLSTSQLVAYNLRRARVLRDCTQEQAAQRLEPYLGARWSSPTFSVAERWQPGPGQKVRQFDAAEVLAFAAAFDLPIGWFFLPPAVPGPVPRLQIGGVSLTLAGLVDLVFGAGLGDPGGTTADQPTAPGALEERLQEVLALFPANTWPEGQRLGTRYWQAYIGAAIRHVAGNLAEQEEHTRDLLEAVARLREWATQKTKDDFFRYPFFSVSKEEAEAILKPPRSKRSRGRTEAKGKKATKRKKGG